MGGGGGCIFIYSSYARLISFEINFITKGASRAEPEYMNIHPLNKRSSAGPETHSVHLVFDKFLMMLKMFMTMYNKPPSRFNILFRIISKKFKYRLKGQGGADRFHWTLNPIINMRFFGGNMNVVVGVCDQAIFLQRLKSQKNILI